jgi:hypothetical protein
MVLTERTNFMFSQFITLTYNYTNFYKIQSVSDIEKKLFCINILKVDLFTVLLFYSTYIKIIHSSLEISIEILQSLEYIF